MYQLVEAVSRSGQNISDFFSLIDSRGRGYITREDFADLFASTKLKIDAADLKRFMDQFWKDDKAGIDYEGFLRIFKRFQVRAEDDARKSKAGRYVPVTEAALRLKKHYFDEIKVVLLRERKSVADWFRRINEDRNNSTTSEELFKMFRDMKLSITQE